MCYTYIFVLAHADKICNKCCVKWMKINKVIVVWILKIQELVLKIAIISYELMRFINSNNSILTKVPISSKGYDLHKKLCKTELIWWSYGTLKFDNSRISNEKSSLFQTNSSDSSIQTVFSLSNFKQTQKSVIWTIKRAKRSRIDKVTVTQSLIKTAKSIKKSSVLHNLRYQFLHFS